MGIILWDRVASSFHLSNFKLVGGEGVGEIEVGRSHRFSGETYRSIRQLQ
jgi:hypothetical protein